MLSVGAGAGRSVGGRRFGRGAGRGSVSFLIFGSARPPAAATWRGDASRAVAAELWSFCDEFWPRSDQDGHRANFGGCLNRLRRRLLGHPYPGRVGWTRPRGCLTRHATEPTGLPGRDDAPYPPRGGHAPELRPPWKFRSGHAPFHTAECFRSPAGGPERNSCPMGDRRMFMANGHRSPVTDGAESWRPGTFGTSGRRSASPSRHTLPRRALGRGAQGRVTGPAARHVSPSPRRRTVVDRSRCCGGEQPGIKLGPVRMNRLAAAPRAGGRAAREGGRDRSEAAFLTSATESLLPVFSVGAGLGPP